MKKRKKIIDKIKINDLSCDVLTEIFLFLNLSSLLKISLVQNYWKVLIDQKKYIWTLIYKDCIGKTDKVLISKEVFKEKFLIHQNLFL